MKSRSSPSSGPSLRLVSTESSTSSNAPSVEAYDRWADNQRYIDLDYSDLADVEVFTPPRLSLTDMLVWLASAILWWFSFVKPAFDLITSLF